MNKLILITGGAGFIGSHLTDRLIESGYRVRVFDNLDPQIHPEGKPDYLNPAAEFVLGDVRDRDALKKAMEGIDGIFHFAAAVGTGQSMYQIEKYASINIGGLSNVLDILVETGQKPKIIFPGSATSYGECAHSCPEHGLQFPELRPISQLERRDWDVHCSACGRVMTPVPIPEHQPLRPKFVYGINKKGCEELLNAVADTYTIPYTILRFFNVYGPRQSLSNPYTGVIAIFSSRLKNGGVPLVIEDGHESRDFISVFDIVEACVLSLENYRANGKTYNVGTGQPVEILSMAKLLVKLHGLTIEPVVNGEFRKNDFRHSLADISAIRNDLGFHPKIDFARGMEELYSWSKDQQSTDTFNKAYEEMKERGIMSKPAEQPLIAVVTLNWNGFNKTVECVKALHASDYTRLKIFVVDNGSNNNEAERLQTLFGGRIEVIPTGKNLGVAGGNNVGLKKALADKDVKYVIMMNNDLVVEPQTVRQLAAPAEVNDKIGMVASRMMNYYQRNLIDNLGIAVTTSGLGYNRKSEWYPLFCPCSGCGLYRADALRKIAMPDDTIWDNDFFAYVDEVDVGFRLRLHGYSAAYSSEGVAYHMEGATSGGATSPFSIYHGHRNNVWLIVKDFPTALLWRHIGGILATQFGTFFLYARRRKLALIIKTKLDALRKLPVMLKRRSYIQRSSIRLSDLESVMVQKVYLSPADMVGPQSTAVEKKNS